MLAKACFGIGAKAGTQADLQTYDMFASTWFAKYAMFANNLTRVVRLANI
jgi:hypothetical protein